MVQPPRPVRFRDISASLAVVVTMTASDAWNVRAITADHLDVPPGMKD
jgi:hypothetical protein